MGHLILKGDLKADGPVFTVAILQQENKDEKKERVRSSATAKTFTYQDADRRARAGGKARQDQVIGGDGVDFSG